MKENSEATACGRPLSECLQTIEAFHGWQAPGLVLGLFMVDWARELIGPQVEADAVVESRHCLPDAVQLFTPCTVGNGWLKILDWDKYALTLYDRRRRTGHRVWFDLEKARAFPTLHQWFMRKVSKKDLPLDAIVEELIIECSCRTSNGKGIYAPLPFNLVHCIRPKPNSIFRNQKYSESEQPCWN